MLRLILGAVGLGSTLAAVAPGCGSVVVESAGSGGDGGSGGASTSAGGTSNGGDGGGGSGGIGGIGGFGGSASVSVGGGNPGCSAPISNDPVDVPAAGPCSVGYMAQYVCFPAPPGNLSCDQVYSQACVLDTYNCGFQSVGDLACGPDPAKPNACCYTVVGDCPVGRPFLVNGRARIAGLVADGGWAEPMAPEAAALNGETRAALADFWGQEALFEHASVASFGRFVLQLLSVGAPADLVRRAQRALAEEIEHAALCFGLASSYGGALLGPSALDIVGGLGEGLGLTEIAIAVAREGCIAESIAALQIAAARDAATDPVVKRALATVAEQESEHALLAWRTLRWALERGDAALHAAVAAVFAAPEAHVGIGPVSALPGDRAAMRGHGCLPPDERRALAAEALANVVLPAARALLAAATGPSTGAQETQRPAPPRSPMAHPPRGWD